MELNAFASRCVRHIDAYMKAVELSVAEARLRDERGRAVRPCYPTVLFISDAVSHFTAELLGSAKERPTSLRVVKRDMPSLASVLGQMEVGDRSMFHLGPGSGGSSISGLALLSARDHHLFEQRYPELAALSLPRIAMDGLEANDPFNALSVSDSSQDLWLNDVLTVNTYQGQIRARYFQSFWTVERECSSSELARRLQQHHPVGGDPVELVLVDGGRGADPIRQAANFASLASIDKIGETTLTTFLEANEMIMSTALGAQRIMGQERLHWLEGNPDPEEVYIQPDFLFIDESRQLHVCEVKLPLLRNKSLTTGKRRRRDFRSPVSEGLSQLAHYNEFLSKPAHKKAIEEKFGALVTEPRLVLLIGSAENYRDQEVREASRSRGNFEILDYDTIRALFLARSGVVPTART